MPFMEYRGSGRHQGADLSRMEKIWDLEWEKSRPNPDVSVLASSENWPLLQRCIPRGSRVLEAGCGPARWVRFLDEHGYGAYGVDFSSTALSASLATWPGLRLVRGDLRGLPFAEATFDAVVSFGAVEHDIHGPEAALRDMFRVLVPGGILYCTVPCYNVVRRLGFLRLSQWLVCNRHVRRWMGRGPDVGFFEYLYTPREYEAILHGVGFELLDLIPLSPYVCRLWGRPGTLRRRIVEALHRASPWVMPHMMAAICCKPPPERPRETDRAS